jgi:hypothetical protein
MMKKLFGLKGEASTEESPLHKFQTDFDWTQHDVIKVYRADQSFRFVAVHETSLVKDVVFELCQQWGLAPLEDYSLCEVTVVHGGLVKQTTLKGSVDNIASSLSVRGRYYLKNNTGEWWRCVLHLCAISVHSLHTSLSHSARHTTAIETLLPDDGKQELMDPMLEVDILLAQPEEIARQLTIKV